jgi:hypothetical protein
MVPVLDVRTCIKRGVFLDIYLYACVAIKLSWTDVDVRSVFFFGGEEGM